MRRPLFTFRDFAIEKAAGDWIARRDRGLSPEEEKALAAWQAADPRHAAEWARLNATWDILDTADGVPEVMQIAQGLERKSVPRRRARGGGSWGLAILGTAAFAGVIGALLWPRLSPVADGAGSPHYQIVPSSARQLVLEDGTRVELNGDSVIAHSFSATERRVELSQGEAHFAVVSDPSRPFVVVAGHVAVQAVGTAFNVRFAPTVVEVLVTQGTVRVDDARSGGSLLVTPEAVPSLEASEPVAPAVPLPPDLAVIKAGQRVLISVEAPAAVAPMAVSAEDLTRALAWQGPQVVFDRTPLAEAIAAFNRFNRCQLVLGDPKLRSRKLGGTFRADNVDTFVRLLEAGFEITVDKRSDEEWVLRPAK